jgi:HK97 family phage major capsid protein
MSEETMKATPSQMTDLVKGVLKDAGLEDLKDRLEEMHRKQTDLVDLADNRKQEQDPTEDVGLLLRCIAFAKGDIGAASKVAIERFGNERVSKALAAQEEDVGGFLIRDELAAGLIELLRPMSVVRSLNPTMVPMDTGTMRMSKLASGSSGGWIGENQNIPATQPAFGQIVLTAKKYASLVPMSNDLLRRAGSLADRTVRDDLLADIGTSTDLAFIRGDGASAQPKGLLNQGTAINANGTVNLANVTTDIGILLQTMGDNNVRMLRPGWIMEWRTWRYLITVRDGNGNFAFKPEMDGGTLFGMPFKVTSQIPRNLGGGSNETELYFCDFADVIIGETTSILVDVSDVAAYHDGSNVVASFSLDQTVIRAIIEVDLGVRHAESVLILDQVKWGV